MRIINKLIILIFMLLAGAIIGASTVHYSENSEFWKSFTIWLFSGDFLKIISSGLLGGIVTGYISLRVSDKNNEASIKKLLFELDYRRNQAMRDECKKYCVEYLKTMELLSLPHNSWVSENINNLVNLICIFIGKDEPEYVKRIILLKAFAREKDIALLRDKYLVKKSMGVELPQDLKDYRLLYVELLNETSEMLSRNAVSK